MMDAETKIYRGLAYVFTLFSTVAIFMLLPIGNMRFDPSDLGDLAYVVLIFAIFATYCSFRRLYRLSSTLEVMMLGLIMTVPILISTYLAASFNFPLADAQLIAADQALGFDWRSFIAFVDGNPKLAATLYKAYTSMGYQMLGIPLLLGIAGLYKRSYQMIIAYGLLCYVSALVSVWFPALGTYVVYGVAESDLASINPKYGFAFLNDFYAVRSEQAFTLSVKSASGIITFPSVHAAAALLCAWAMWPVKPFGYLFAAWNAMMAISAVSHANHYLVDVFAGLAIAAASIALVSRAARWMLPSKSRPAGSTQAEPATVTAF